MPRRLGWLFAVMLTLPLALTGCLLAPVSITEANDGSIVTVDVGDAVLVRLAGNPSTGYAWMRESPQSLVGSPLAPVAEETCTTPQGCAPIAGEPSAFEFRYEAVSSGTVTLSYVYQRPWEDEPIDRFTVVVWVR